MKLNEKKTKNMIFNFTRKYQFTTNMSVNQQPIEIVRETRLLGTIVTQDLKWNKNTAEIVRKAWKRMQLLNRAAGFTNCKQDLIKIYLTYIRSALEQSAVVWHSSLSSKNRRDLERVQKVAVRVILGKNYTSYKNGLQKLNIEALDERREKICLKFAKKCLGNEKLRSMFPKNVTGNIKRRKTKVFKTKLIKTKRYKNSAIPYMVNLLNNEDEKKKKILKF